MSRTVCRHDAIALLLETVDRSKPRSSRPPPLQSRQFYSSSSAYSFLWIASILQPDLPQERHLSIRQSSETYEWCARTGVIPASASCSSEAFRRMIENVKEMVEKVYPPPPMYLYMHRTIFGLRVLCYRLSCRVDFRSLREQEKRPWV